MKCFPLTKNELYIINVTIIQIQIQIQIQNQNQNKMQSPKSHLQSPKSQQQSPKSHLQSPKSSIIEFLRFLFKNKTLQVLPQVLDITKIDNIMDKGFLAKLEYQYEKFLEANMQILDLYNVIDYLLDVRDAILLKLNRMIREEKIKKYNEEYYMQKKTQTKSEEKNNTKILIEYKCGCQNLINYISFNDSSSTSFSSSTSGTSGSNRHHCIDHLKLLKTQNILENELTRVKGDLNDAMARHNIRSINYCK